LVLLDSVSDGTLSSLPGLDRDEDFAGDEDFAAAEREEADLLVLISPDLPAPLLTESKQMTAHGSGVLWQGRANTLSPKHSVE
jgi:hypothetical protein